jgi:hypothetical protein
MPHDRQTVSPARTGVWHWGQLKMGAVAGSMRERMKKNKRRMTNDE